MNKEEIRKALRIIKEPITVNTTTYHYFDQENYDKLQRVYDNCQWFINNEEQLIQNIEYQQQELERYKNIVEEAIKYLNDCKKTIENDKDYEIEDYLVSASILLEILQGKSDE